MASQDGSKALMKAAQGGHKDTVEVLLDRGADLEAKCNVIHVCGSSHRAVQHERLKRVKSSVANMRPWGSGISSLLGNEPDRLDTERLRA